MEVPLHDDVDDPRDADDVAAGEDDDDNAVVWMIMTMMLLDRYVLRALGNWTSPPSPPPQPLPPPPPQPPLPPQSLPMPRQKTDANARLPQMKSNGS